MQTIIKDYGELYKFIRSQKKDDGPTIVLVGGNSRAGKSTLTRDLAWRIERNGKTVQTVYLDDWIKGISKRKENGDVFDRFQMDKMELDFEKLVGQEEITINPYDYRIREAGTAEKKIKLNNTGVIIIEGVVALAIQSLRNVDSIKIFVETAESNRRVRFNQFYTDKGFDADHIEELYKTRVIDEVGIINETKVKADIVFNRD